MRLKYGLVLLIAAITILSGRTEIVRPVKHQKSSFGIIIDRESYLKTEAAVRGYQAAVEADGLATYLMIVDETSPEEIRHMIINLKEDDPLIEGVVLIGDIPIPMIRDAQHLTSAFKMDQERFPRHRSSVPSDRFYDDFDLKFDFIAQDTSNRLLYYYSLSAESAQKIEREIYSARIRPSGVDADKYGHLDAYLKRIAAQKNEQQVLNNLMRYTGHGYNSESLSAWEAEALTLREQFPQMFIPGGSLTSLEHSMSADLKSIIMNHLQKPELDLVIFHAHGGVEAQYLLGYPPAENIAQNVAAIKLFIRSKLRQAKRDKRPVEETIQYYQDQYGIPETWFEGAFDDSVMVADSLYSANLDMNISDIELIETGAEMLIFDQCFNGAFQQERYIAGEYVFGNGRAVAGVANSVNVKQDIWANEGLGLLGYNLRIGQWHRERSYLETHIIGDPTFRFRNPEQKDWALLIEQNADKIRFWERLLKSEEIPLRALAVRNIGRIQGAQANRQLVDIYRHDTSYIVRLSALKGLAAIRSAEFEALLFQSAKDPYELIRRFSVQWMGVVGREDYLPVLVEAVVFDPSKRVAYLAKGAIEKIAPQKAAALFEEVIQKLPESSANNEFLNWMRNSYERSTARLRENIIPELTTDSLSLKTRISAVRTLRNYQYQETLPVLLTLVSDEKEDPGLRIIGLEALGWYAFSYNRSAILSACENLLQRTETSADVKTEALKTKQRIIAGYTDPLNP